MRIVIPILRFGRSGGERVISKLASGLSSEGHDVTFIVPKGNDVPYYATTAKIITFEGSKSHFKIFRWISNYFNMLVSCKNVNADAVIATYHQMAYIALFLPRKMRRIYYIQAYEVNFYTNIIGKFFAGFTYVMPFEKIVNSECILPRFINNYRACIPAGVDYNLFFGERRNATSGSRPINIGIIGRKEPYKGTKEVLDTLLKYIKYNKLENKVVINVAVYLADEYKSKGIKYHEVNNDVELAGFYKLNDIFVATGLVEYGAFHYPCAESMVAGCLTISNYAPLTDTDSCLKIIGFSQNEIIEKLNKAMNIYLSGEYFEIERNQNAMLKYSWDNISRSFNDIVNER